MIRGRRTSLWCSDALPCGQSFIVFYVPSTLAGQRFKAVPVLSLAPKSSSWIRDGGGHVKVTERAAIRGQKVRLLCNGK